MPERRRRYHKENSGNRKERSDKSLIDKILGRGRQRLFRLGAVAVLSVALSIGASVCAKPSSQENLHQELILQFYPELAGRRVQSSDEFTVQGKSVRVLNFTASLFDAQNATAKYEYFDNLPKELPLVGMRISNEDVVFSLQNQPPTDRVLFLVPFNQKSPSWSRLQPAVDYAGTGIDNKTKTRISYIKISDQQLRELIDNNFKVPFDPNDNFDIEACQSSVVVIHPNTRLKQLGQEFICNSFGLAASGVTKKLSHSEYSSFMQQSSKALGVSFPVLPQDFYNRVPLTEKVLL